MDPHWSFVPGPWSELGLSFHHVGILCTLDVLGRPSIGPDGIHVLNKGYFGHPMSVLSEVLDMLTVRPGRG